MCEECYVIGFGLLKKGTEEEDRNISFRIVTRTRKAFISSLSSLSISLPSMSAKNRGRNELPCYWGIKEGRRAVKTSRACTAVTWQPLYTPASFLIRVPFSQQPTQKIIKINESKEEEKGGSILPTSSHHHRPSLRN